MLLAWLVYVLALVANKLNLSLVITRNSSSLLWIVLTAAVPLANVLFCSEIVMGAHRTSLTTYAIAGKKSDGGMRVLCCEWVCVSRCAVCDCAILLGNRSGRTSYLAHYLRHRRQERKCLCAFAGAYVCFFFCACVRSSIATTYISLFSYDLFFFCFLGLVVVVSGLVLYRCVPEPHRTNRITKKDWWTREFADAWWRHLTSPWMVSSLMDLAMSFFHCIFNQLLGACTSLLKYLFFYMLKRLFQNTFSVALWQSMVKAKSSSNYVWWRMKIPCRTLFTYK